MLMAPLQPIIMGDNKVKFIWNNTVLLLKCILKKWHFGFFGTLVFDMRGEKTTALCTSQGVAESYQLDVMSVIMTALGIHIPKQDIVAMTWKRYYCH